MNRLPILGALILGAAFSLPGISHAQATAGETPTEIEIEPLETAQIVVSNVASNLMAYWFDPLHQPTPIPLQMSQQNAGILFSRGIGIKPQPGNGNGPSGLKLPAGVRSFASIDPQNILWVRGTKTAIEALQKQVKEIDVPLKQVEFEVQIWEMSPATLTSLPLVFRDTSTPADAKKSSRQTDDKKDERSPFNPDFLSRIALAAPMSDIAPTTKILASGLKNKSAALIATPRVSVIDGLVATTQSTESRALLLADKTNEKTDAAPQTKPKNQEETPPKPDVDTNALPEGIAFISGQTGVTIAPVLHGDAMSLAFSILLDGNMTQATTTLRDGQTLAIRLPNANSATGWPRVALITPRIIHRADDK